MSDLCFRLEINCASFLGVPGRPGLESFGQGGIPQVFHFSIISQLQMPHRLSFNAHCDVRGRCHAILVSMACGVSLKFQFAVPSALFRVGGSLKRKVHFSSVSSDGVGPSWAGRSACGGVHLGLRQWTSPLPLREVLWLESSWRSAQSQAFLGFYPPSQNALAATLLPRLP